MANTVIDKQRAKTIAIFVPEDEVMSKYEQGLYWKDPNQFASFANPTGILNAADVCVDGTSIQSVTMVAPALSAATVPPGSTVGPLVTLTLTGSNLVQGDTQVIVGTAPNTASGPVITTDGKTGSAQIALPPGYAAGTTTAILQSKSNPSLTSGTGVAITEK
ncbi:MAG: hypothetical protein WBR21_05725 [Rouxiella badensis]|uniref:hypothetical protein n=1 Tax=Rouxiella badensis TaxID=1646377 RepID=UPI003C4E4B96